MNKKTEINVDNLNKFDEDIFQALFRKGAHEYLEEDFLKELPADKNNKDITLSDTFEKRTKKIIKQSLRKERWKDIIGQLPKMAAVVIIALTILSVAIFSVEALRIKVFNLFIETKENVTDIFLDDNDAKSSNFIPAFIPEGYVLSSSEETDERKSYIYTDQNDNKILIYQFDENYNIGVDTENADYGDITIDGYQGFYSVKNGFTTQVFKTEEYAFLIRANLDASVVEQIAESIK